MFMKTLKSVWPFTLFIIIVLLLLKGLHLNPQEIPSVLIDQTVPSFKVAALSEKQPVLTDKAFHGQVSLLNVWATWCKSCKQDHAMLMNIARSHKVKVFGLDYKDNRKDALAWLQQYGNPYSRVGFDATGDVAIDWGVYGTPETFIIDKQGVVRYKHIGPLTGGLNKTKSPYREVI